jgi:hypothetical protein
MQVAAFSNPSQPDWRWRIVDYAGTVVEESRLSFRTIALAIEEGRRRLRELDVDQSTPRPIYRTSYLRSARPRKPA